MKIQRILHPTDFQPWSRSTLPLAGLLAKKLDAELHVLHVEPMRGDDAAATEPPELQALALEPFLREVRLVTACRRAFTAASAIVGYVVDHGIDLVVMGSHDLHGNVWQLLRSDAIEVAHQSPCSVLTVQAEGSPAVADLGTILVPFDYSHEAREALRWAATIARRWGARIVLFHVIEESRWDSHDLSPERETSRRQCHHQAELRLGDIADFLVPGATVDLDVRFGSPAREILSRAQRGVDLVVMASHGFSATKTLLLGSVADEVQRLAEVPVLLVKVEPRDELRRAM